MQQAQNNDLNFASNGKSSSVNDDKILNKPIATSQKLRFYELMADKSLDDIKDQQLRLLKARSLHRSTSISKQSILISGRGRNARIPHSVD